MRFPSHRGLTVSRISGGTMLDGGSVARHSDNATP